MFPLGRISIIAEIVVRVSSHSNILSAHCKHCDDLSTKLLIFLFLLFNQNFPCFKTSERYSNALQESGKTFHSRKTTSFSLFTQDSPSCAFLMGNFYLSVFFKINFSTFFIFPFCLLTLFFSPAEGFRIQNVRSINFHFFFHFATRFFSYNFLNIYSLNLSQRFFTHFSRLRYFFSPSFYHLKLFVRLNYE